MKRTIAIISVACALTVAACASSTTPGFAPPSYSGHHLPSAKSNGFRLVYAWPGDAEPFAGLTYLGGTFYGTTAFSGNGSGTVYSVTPNGNQQVLYSFSGNDGAVPQGDLAVMNGLLYGTTSQGGAYQDGTVFSISTGGSFNVLHNFGGPDGRAPVAGLTSLNGTLYGVTRFGGTNDQGAVFSITSSGTENVIYSFTGTPDGAQPAADLVNVNGVLYGTTAGGGTNDSGTAFSITPGGVESVLHSFGSGSDGVDPLGRLIYVDGTFYGTTTGGGTTVCEGFISCGTVFSMTPSGSEQVLHSFNPFQFGDGWSPWAGVTEMKGVLYGTTQFGGVFSYGTVYSITKRGAEKVLYYFENSGDGNSPLAPLVSLKGTLYGTALGCGSTCGGTVFALRP